MKRKIRILLFSVSLAICFNLAYAGGSSKVLIIVREGSTSYLELMLTREVGVMIDIIKNAGYKIDVASATGQPIVASETRKLTPNLKLSNAKVGDYVGILMPCMAAGPPYDIPDAIRIIQQAVAQEKPLAAQTGSINVLAEAGVLKGKNYAYYYDIGPYDTRFDGAIYSNKPVVKDGRIITSCCCPAIELRSGEVDMTAELTQTFIDELNRN